MSQRRRIYCKFCDYFCYKPEDFISHLEKEHSDFIPEDMTAWQFSYYLRFNKMNGSCVVCHGKTRWNEKTHKYNRFCDNENCKQKYREEFKKRMIGKYGKVTLLNDPEQQKKMLANRSISGEYEWRDHVHKSQYTGSYEKSFLEFLDTVMNFDPSDIMSPSPHTYYYMYNNQKHFYIPDFFIPSLQLEIEIKDGGDNPNMHHKIQDVDKVKEKLKDDVMTHNHFNYLKIVNKDNTKFLEYLSKAKEQFFDDEKNTSPIYMTESVTDLEHLVTYVIPMKLHTVPRDEIPKISLPEDCPKSLADINRRELEIDRKLKSIGIIPPSKYVKEAIDKSNKNDEYTSYSYESVLAICEKMKNGDLTEEEGFELINRLRAEADNDEDE